MEIKEIKKILESCQEGDILFHTYITIKNIRQYVLFALPEEDQIRFVNSKGSRPLGHSKTRESVVIDTSMVRLRWMETLGVKHPIIDGSYVSTTIRDGDEIYTGPVRIIPALKGYRMSETHIWYAKKLCEQGAK